MITLFLLLTLAVVFSYIFSKILIGFVIGLFRKRAVYSETAFDATAGETADISRNYVPKSEFSMYQGQSGYLGDTMLGGMFTSNND